MLMRFQKSVLLLPLLLACGGGDGAGPGPQQTLASIAVTPTSFTVAAGSAQPISVTGTDTQGQPISNLTVQLSSQNTALAEVTGSEVLGIAVGSTTINVTASKGGVTKTASVAATVTGTLPLQGTVLATVTSLFTPKTIAIARTGTVTWSISSLGHTVTFESAAGAPANIPETPNANIGRTFNTAGNFAYTCQIHAGMSGLVIVR